jgi:hypothetical protein
MIISFNVNYENSSRKKEEEENEYEERKQNYLSEKSKKKGKEILNKQIERNKNNLLPSTDRF